MQTRILFIGLALCSHIIESKITDSKHLAHKGKRDRFVHKGEKGENNQLSLILKSYKITDYKFKNLAHIESYLKIVTPTLASLNTWLYKLYIYSNADCFYFKVDHPKK